jgi:hypothetical protein
MPAASKRAKKVRAASEFDVMRLAAALRAPKVNSGAFAWTLEQVKTARDAQLCGQFKLPAQLAAAMRTDDACFVAYQNRLAPQRGLPVKLVAPNESARAKRVLDEAEALYGCKGVGVSAGALESINGDLANHGVAFGINYDTPRLDGSRIDVEHHHWPIEWVSWNAVRREYMTQIDPGTGSEGDHAGQFGSLVPITHGDGRWVIYQKHENEPWRQEACVLAAALVWADHAYGRRDRSKAATSMGSEKWVGTMPEGIALQVEGGALSDDAEAMMILLEAVASLDNPIGILPSGAKVDRMVNTSSAWQIFKEILDGNASAAQRIYLGQDAMLGVQSQGPGVDAAALWGVRDDIVEGDLAALERGFYEGVIQPWCAVNFGDSTLAPWRKYLLPDADEDARHAALATRTAAFFDAIKQTKEQGFDASQSYVDALALDFGVKAPLLPMESNKAPSIALAPTDIARVVSVNEARASAGLGPLLLNGAPDPDGTLTVEEFSAKKAAKLSTPSAPSGSAGPGPTPIRPAAPPAAAARRS